MPASIVFLEDGAVISAEVDSPSAHANTPLRKCVNALLTYCPQGFHSKVERGNKSQGVIMEVTVCASLVDEIPLLSDIRSSTQASKKRRETGDDSEKRNSFDPPCSIVGLFSVLLLHEQLVTVDGWLGDSSHPEKCLEDPMLEDPMLALETLQMADFLAMKGVRGQVVGWFQTLLHNLASAERVSLTHTYAFRELVDGYQIESVMHVTKVLSSVVQPQFCSEMFTHLAGDVTADKLSVVDLPEEVLCMWLRCQGPILDFSEFSLNSVQWVKLLHCIVSARLEATALRMLGPVDNSTVCNASQHASIQRLCSVLQGVHSACACLRGLKVLQLKNFPIHASHVPLLASIFESVSCSLEELCMGYLGFRDASGKPKTLSYDSKARQMFFIAVAKLKKLRVLKLISWNKFILQGVSRGARTEETKAHVKQIISPLLQLPDLEEVQVPKVENSLAFTVEPRLKFTEATF